ncbi:peptidoglycan-binding domain-containing protein [Luteibacter sp. 3190]|uniref:peptidoglycan-binding domain-containing protein n=1 Tax=Luteibacter sp. 3190 TaxID=2817736 RepID=UPI0028561838|nr:peptidoglycan-binding domain-containing protein [Luteibacter sp. 3190]MDR6937395.1 hypothetical protein [Luteibacter sp. 3190]
MNKGRAELGKNELRAIAYFAVGVSSEGSFAGRDKAYKLSFAGYFDENGRMFPVENSGLSYGTLQKDLGQAGRSHVAHLLDAHQAWARAYSPADVLADDERAQAEIDFARTGRQVREENGRPINVATRDKIDRFLRSDAGRDLVHQSDRAEVDGLVDGPLRRLEATPAFEQASLNDKVRLAVVVAKGYNQNRVKTNQLLDRMADGGDHPRTLHDFEDVFSYTEHFSEAMRSGRDAALRAGDLFIGLRESSPSNPLSAAWSSVLDDPLMAPSDVARHEDADVPIHHAAIRNLFLEPKRAKAFLDSIDQGIPYKHGFPQPEAGRKATSGFYTSGAEIVQWNADGRGVAFLNGSWSEIHRNEITRELSPDSSVDLHLTRDGEVHRMLQVRSGEVPRQRAVTRSLRQGMTGTDVRDLQDGLARLHYTDSRGRPLNPDGDFGPTTRAALQAFQRDHRLAADGVAGPATFAAIRELVREETRSIGEPHTVYPGINQRSDALSPYQTLQQDSVPSLRDSGATWNLGFSAGQVDASQAPTVTPPCVDQPMLQRGDLNNLGMTDSRARHYAAHIPDGSNPGRRLGHAHRPEEPAFSVKDTQNARHSIGDSKSWAEAHGKYESFRAEEQSKPDAPQAIGEETRSIEWRAPVRQPHMEHQASYDARSLASFGEREARAEPGRDLNDPRNPESAYHGLYSELGRRVPYASEDRLVQFTAACHTSRITADNLSICHLDERNLTMGFLGNGPLSLPVTVDLKKAPPEPEQAVAQIARYDQQQALVRSEYLSQQMQRSRSGPSL